MAEMNVPESGAKKGKKKARSKKASTRVDLTAMVDLGFLLITFFMLATTMNKPKAMEVNKPAKDKEKDKEELPEIKQSKTYSIILGKNNMAYCYTGADDDANVKVDSTFFSRAGLRAMIKQRQNEVQQQWGDKDELFIMIKPLPDSKYRNMVDILDEMAICGVKRYAIIDEFNSIDEGIGAKSGNRLKADKGFQIMNTVAVPPSN
jgi:biopolymer transport protein ExbD